MSSRGNSSSTSTRSGWTRRVVNAVLAMALATSAMIIGLPMTAAKAASGTLASDTSVITATYSITPDVVPYGGTATIRVTVTNSGSAFLDKGSVGSASCGPQGFTKVSGPDTLAWGAEAIWECTTPPLYSNTAEWIRGGYLRVAAIGMAANFGSMSPVTTIQVGPKPSTDFSLAKTLVSPTGNAAPGQQVTWRAVATNNGPGVSSNFTLTDNVPAGFTNVAASMPGATCTVTGNAVRCTPDQDVPSGSIMTATITANAPSTSQCYTNTASITTAETDPNAANNTSSAQCVQVGSQFSLTKTSTGVSGPNAQGAFTASYAIKVTNNGASAASYPALTDTPQFDPNLRIASATWSGQASGSKSFPAGTTDYAFPITTAATSLAAGATHTYNVDMVYTYIDPAKAIAKCAATAGPGQGLYNSASLAGGTIPAAGSCVDAPSGTQTAKLTVEKSSSAIADSNNSKAVDAGDTVIYTIKVTNSGTFDLTNVTITDANLGLDKFKVADTLAVGASTTYTSAPYMLTQADIDAGKLVNNATATGTTPNGTTPPTAGAGTDTKTIPASGSMSMVKSSKLNEQGTANNTAEVGESITYSFLVTNTGNVTINNVAINDPMLTGLAITCPSTTLAPKAFTTCTAAPKVITQKMVDDAAAGGKIVNSATATATGPNGTNISVTSPPATTSTDVNATAKVTLTIDAKADGPVAAGTKITYTYTAKNDGTTTLTGVKADSSLGSGASCVIGTLAPGETKTCTVVHTVTQDQVDAGKVTNTATVTATSPKGNVTETQTSTTAIAGNPALSMIKSATLNDTVAANKLADVGESISYSFAVTNTGNVTINGIRINDAKLSGLNITCPLTALAPGASTTCSSAPMVITQKMIDDAVAAGGNFANSATATGTGPGGTTVTVDSGPSTTNTPVNGASKVTMTMSTQLADPNNNGAEVGEKITYTYTAKNEGNTTLTGVKATSSLGADAGCVIGTLAPGESKSCTVVYTITQPNADAGKVANDVTVVATTPKGDISVQGSSSTPITSKSGLQLGLKATTIDVDGNKVINANDQATYALTLTNAGNVTLTNPTVSVDVLKLTNAPMDDKLCTFSPAYSGSLAPGASITCTLKPMVIDQTKVDAGSQLVAIANASATEPNTTRVSASPARAEVALDSRASLSLLKEAGLDDVDGNKMASLGEKITYFFTITNNGTQSVTGVGIVDDMLTRNNVGITCPSSTVAPGASIKCTSAPYTVTVADLKAGGVENSATARGERPGGVTANPGDDVIAPASVAKVSAKVPVEMGNLSRDGALEYETAANRNARLMEEMRKRTQTALANERAGGRPLASTGADATTMIALWAGLGLLGAGAFLIIGGRTKKARPRH